VAQTPLGAPGQQLVKVFFLTDKESKF
jgi:hypothetical protein